MEPGNTVCVLRLGHRLPRDERITTHVCLVARAFGAKQIFYAGQHDSSLELSVSSIASNWGGDFSVTYDNKYINLIKKYKKDGFIIIHLTMYGLPLNEEIEKIIRIKDKHANLKILVVVGAEKVEKEVYELADYNLAVTSQPHSEVAALAITLDRIMQGQELERKFNEKFIGKIKLVPNKKGKTIKKND